MRDADAGWEHQVSDLWAGIDRYTEDDFVARIGELVALLPPGSAIGLFERGAAFDSTGHPNQAIPLYAAALEAGLMGERRRRAVIQMASSLRNLGHPQDALDLLTDEAKNPSDSLDGAVATFTALALADLGREREAVVVALLALSTYLPRYNRSVKRFAKALIDAAEDEP